MRDQSDAHFLHHLHRNKPANISVKDLYAQASCIAAYLRLQDFQPGTAVAVAAWNGPFQIIVDLALQFIGAIQIPVPQNSSEADLAGIMHTHNPQIWFVENESLLKQLGELQFLKPHLKEIIINDEIEHLDYSKLIAFERVIEFGKTLWRENQQLMSDTRMGIHEKMTMAQPTANTSGRNSKLSFRGMIQLADTIQQKLQALGLKTIASVIDPCSLPGRIAAWYAPLLNKCDIYLLNSMEVFLRHPARPKFQALVIHPDTLEKHIRNAVVSLTEQGWLTKNWMNRTLNLVERKYLLLAQGQKLPAGLRLSLMLLRSLHYGKVRKAIAGGTLYLILDAGRLPTPTEHLLLETGFKILYIDDLQAT